MHDPDDAEERRAEQAAWEALAATDALRRRGLLDVAVALVHAGDRVAVTCGHGTWTGVLVHAAGDLACLAATGLRVDLRLGAPWALEVIEVVARGGASVGGAPSFRARLAEHEASGSVLALHGPALTGPMAGLHARVTAVATDHLVLTEAEGAGSTCVAPIDGVAAAVVVR